MKLSELKAMGGFVPSAPVAYEVTWRGNTFTVFIKRLSFGGIERLFLAENDDRSKSARYIAEAVCFEEGGKQPMAYADAYALEPTLARVLLDAVNAVNDSGSADPKN